MQKFFLHLGAHKTGTKFIQSNLAANHKRLAAQNWTFLPPLNKSPAFKAIMRLRDEKKLQPRGENQINRFFTRLKKSPSNVFLSSETLLGSMSIMSSKSVIYPHHAHMIAQLKNRLADRSVKVGFCVRSFTDFVESGYNWRVSRGASIDFEKYIRFLEVEKLSWVSIIDRLTEAFGAENVVLWTYEDFKTDAVGTFKKLMRTAEIEPAALTVNSNPRNVSLTPEGRELILTWNKLLDRQSEFDTKKKKHLVTQMRRIIEELPRSGTPVSLLSEEQKKMLDERYKEELSIISNKWPSSMLSAASTRISSPAPAEGS